MNEKTDLNDGQIQLAVTGANCASCVNTIESATRRTTASRKRIVSSTRPCW